MPERLCNYWFTCFPSISPINAIVGPCRPWAPHKQITRQAGWDYVISGCEEWAPASSSIPWEDSTAMGDHPCATWADVPNFVRGPLSDELGTSKEIHGMNNFKACVRIDLKWEMRGSSIVENVCGRLTWTLPCRQTQFRGIICRTTWSISVYFWGSHIIWQADDCWYPTLWQDMQSLGYRNEDSYY